MKKKRIVNTKPVPAMKKIVIDYFCDVCSAKVGETNFTQCVLCGRDICKKTYDSCTNYNPEDDSDENKYCPDCFNFRFFGYQKLYQDIEDEYTEKIKSLNNRIKQRVLEQAQVKNKGE